jgi:hypothetical protein
MHTRLKQRMPVLSECLQQSQAFSTADIIATRPKQRPLQSKHSKVAASEREEPYCK